jgi:hypothetical protein
MSPPPGVRLLVTYTTNGPLILLRRVFIQKHGQAAYMERCAADTKQEAAERAALDAGTQLGTLSAVRTT